MERLESITASLVQINNIVDDTVKDSLKGIVRKIALESMHGRDYAIFAAHFRELANTFNICLSVESIKTLTRACIDMWNNPIVARNVMRNVYDINIKEERRKATNIYRKASTKGNETNKNIRLMVLGMARAGKTSLVNNLIEDSGKPSDIKSTEGIKVHKCQILDRKWKCYEPNKEERIKGVIVPQIFEVHFPIEPSALEILDTIKSESENEQNASNIEIIYQRDLHMELIYSREKKKEGLVKDDTVHLATVSSSNDRCSVLMLGADRQGEDPPPLVSVWDFAGQNIYYTTHHFFLNNRSIYLLLLDLSKPLHFEVECWPAGTVFEPCTCKETVKFWLNSIHMYSLIHNETRDVKPTLILVGTHKDKLNMSDLEKEQYKETYFKEALSEFQGTDVLCHIYKRKFLVNNLNDGSPEFEQIKQTVEKLASVQNYWNEEFPARWIELEQYLGVLREDGEALITFDSVRKAILKMTSPIEEENELRVFLKTQHHLGNILYFETDELKDLVILNPTWAIEAFKTFIGHIKEKKPVNLKQWRRFENCAMLTNALIDEFLDEAEKSIKTHKKEVLGFLRKLDILAEPVRLEDNATEDEDKSIYEYVPEDFYIVPCLLRIAISEGAIKMLIHQPESNIIRRTPVLCYQFKNGFMPPAIFHRLQASCIRSWEIKKNEDEYLLYYGFGVFYVTGDCTTILVIWYKDHRVYFRFFDTTLRKIESFIDVVNRTRITLESSLKAILGIVSKDTRKRPYEEYIQCDRCPWEPGKHLFRKNDFENMNAKACGDHFVTFSHIFGFWFTKELPCMIGERLDMTASDSQLSQLAKLLNVETKSTCFEFGTELGIPQEQMKRLEHDDKSSSLIYKVLRCWGNYKRPIKVLWKKMLELRMNIDCFDQVFLHERHSHSSAY